MPLQPLILTPALPSELLTYLANHAHHPTTLLVCSSRTDFLSSLISDVQHQTQPPALQEDNSSSSPADGPPNAVDQPDPDPKPNPGPKPNVNPKAKVEPEISPQPNPKTKTKDHPLLHSPLHQVARTLHIRTLFIPTVSHLRALLPTLSSHTQTHTHSHSHTNPNPPNPNPRTPKIPPPPPNSPLLLIYGLLSLHRDTSEWSAQGLGSTVAGVVEAGQRMGLRVVVVEPVDPHGEGREGSGGRGGAALEEMLKEGMPLLSSAARRMIEGEGDAREGWRGRRVDVGRVLGRWFEVRDVRWGEGRVGI